MADSSVSNVDIAAHTWSAVVSKLNDVITLVNTKVVTTEANSTGALTTGNAVVNGVFSSTRGLAVSGNSTVGLRGGSVAASDTLFIHSNVSISVNVFSVGTDKLGTNSTHLFSNANTIVLGTNLFSVVGPTSLSGNLTFQSGNATVNTQISANSSKVQINSAAIALGGNTTVTGDLTVTGSIGGSFTLDAASITYTPNVLANWTSSLDPGNSNTALDQLAARIKNVEGLTGAGSDLNTNNVIANTSVLVGNSTVNTFILPTKLRIANLSGEANLAPDALLIGGAVVNTTTIAMGANALLQSNRLFLGNSTINAVATTTFIQVANTVGSATLDAGKLVIGTAQINSTALIFGSNVHLSQSLLSVGNSSVNCRITPSTLFVGREINNSQFNSYGSRTVSTSAPTGGSDGDIWYVTA